MKSNLMGLGALVFTVFLLAGCGSKSDEDLGQGGGKAAVASTGAMGTASISGKVSLNGKAPAPATIDMSADPVCRSEHSDAVKDPSVIQNPDGTLQNVFVYVKDGAGVYPAPATPVTLAQKGCMYSPHVLGMQAGQALEIVNTDPTLHNVHCMAAINDPFNLAQPSQDSQAQKVLSKPEVMVKFKCDVHTWMSCFVGVVSNPFFGVSGTDGTFKISGLPAGTYTLEAWHEKYGTSDQTVTLKDGETRAVNFTFNAR
jgi:plastocyanin